MNLRNVSVILAALILACTVFLPAARADEWNQKTKLTFSQPVEIPGRILPAGTYWFVLLNNQSNRNIVEIFNGNWSKLEATLITVPTDRMEPRGVTQIQFAERRHDKPEALLKWYYPGLLTGHQFLYRPRHQREFQRDAKLNELARPGSSGSEAMAG